MCHTIVLHAQFTSPTAAEFYWGWDNAQIIKVLGSTSIRHRFDAKVSDRCLIHVNPMVFAIWVSALLSTSNLCSRDIAGLCELIGNTRPCYNEISLYIIYGWIVGWKVFCYLNGYGIFRHTIVEYPMVNHLCHLPVKDIFFQLGHIVSYARDDLELYLKPNMHIFVHLRGRPTFCPALLRHAHSVKSQPVSIGDPLAWISNHMPSKVWDETTYPFPLQLWKFENGLVISPQTL